MSDYWYETRLAEERAKIVLSDTARRLLQEHKDGEIAKLEVELSRLRALTLEDVLWNGVGRDSPSLELVGRLCKRESFGVGFSMGDTCWVFTRERGWEEKVDWEKVEEFFR